jgi:Rps23 Pro-64 3,4-dihydroxylase Tpa1-like proline 4-hydroxylase
MSSSSAVSGSAGVTLHTPVLVGDGFLPLDLAEAMRRDIEAHFAEPSAQRADTHQIWNYWFVPELYTYLRTSPEKIIRRSRVESFLQMLRGWSVATLGMGQITWPYLSLYTSGCRQGWHNDSGNGRFGFVYSLTKNVRHTIGGETLILHEADPFRNNLTRPTAGRGLYEAIEPRFNRLVVFDDRLPHAVERVDGTMDPIEGRFVLHGHLSEAEPAVTGALPASAALEPIAAALRIFATEAAARVLLYHGPLALRLTINASGSVVNCSVLLDRVIHRDPGDAEWQNLRAQLIARLSEPKFPAALGETVVIQPVLFGPPLPTGR